MEHIGKKIRSLRKNKKMTQEQLDSNDEVILIKDTLTSGNTLKNSLSTLTQIEGLNIAAVIVSVNCNETVQRKICLKTSMNYKISYLFYY